MFTGGVMHNIPDIRVLRTANEYQEVASLCNQHRKIWGGAINAALAIEIYLKSFLSEEVRISIGDQAYIGFKKTERGHDLLALYKKITPNLQTLLCEQYELINPKSALPDLLQKHKDVFFHARYAHEEDAIKSVGNDIIFLAEDLRKAVIKVAEIVHPPITKPVGLEEAVARHKESIK
jgi:hypothetical protein